MVRLRLRKPIPIRPVEWCASGSANRSPFAPLNGAPCFTTQQVVLRSRGPRAQTTKKVTRTSTRLVPAEFPGLGEQVAGPGPRDGWSGDSNTECVIDKIPVSCLVRLGQAHVMSAHACCRADSSWSRLPGEAGPAVRSVIKRSKSNGVGGAEAGACPSRS